ncbi:MAG: homoserine O-succinyltransferase MetA [Gammaproteobacteria bacterium]
MSLIAHSDLPTFERLRAEGHDVLSVERAGQQDIRELHIGFLNLMPDAALEATERQFIRLIDASNRIVQFYVHPFTVHGLKREGRAAEHVKRHYSDFDDIRQEGLDALVITGANPVQPDITQEGFWTGMCDVIEWAREHVCSTLMSCLASHAAFHRYHGVERYRLPQKRWGVYAHRVVMRDHPLVSNINSRFDTPHSRVYQTDSRPMSAAGLRVLVDSDEAGFLVATSPDGLRSVYVQGHPEYDRQSLLKEYKREVMRYATGVYRDYPPLPQHFFNAQAERIVLDFRERLIDARQHDRPQPEFPEADIIKLLDNTWGDTGKALFNNWLGLVYQLTDADRKRPFAPGVNPTDPLNLKKGVGGD